MGSNKLQANDDGDWEFLRYFTNCTRLQVIDLSDNTLGGILPSFIANLSSSIQWLSMAKNQISGIIPLGIGSLNGLEDLEFQGSGKYGSVYRGNMSLPSAVNVVVAVKVFTLQHASSSRSSMAECEALRNVKHRNLIKIITCCSSMDTRGNDFRALVFEFMPKYSLDRWLHPRIHEQTHKLSIAQLLNIAVDVADAIDHLHNNSCPTVIHCDLKPSNILLSADWIAYVADIGLAKLVGESIEQSSLSAGDSSTVGIRGTIGYVAPEYGAGGQASVVGDAYSFGITLLEMFTGKAPTDNMFREGLTLHLHAEMTLPEKISEIIDPALLHVEQYDNDAEILTCLSSVIEVGVSCSKENPSERMDMKHAAAKLNRIREGKYRE
ncbi:putative receptor-like protein kinase At3g47110 [Oryza glaberrima]|uniref:putative receptor-like protein kinase At3g47110 n=1 Tax=Oryza glaberrima TaxID=4538 RepID=UPI00224C3DD8|nr:putative receptor-like protein kinase At3g47110 [Oryza glaberrima]